MRKLQNITLELSGKAFHNDTDTELRRVCTQMYHDWSYLIEQADSLSILLWLADGSEILEYRGNPADTFEWNCYQGVANANPNRPQTPSERMKRHIHFYPQRIRPDAAPRSYRWIKSLTHTIREIAAAQFPGKPVRIGATFDNGPEFAISDFKYKRHREIALGNSIYANSFVICTATLHADSIPYAGFPDGIPEGTSIGTFLGRQFHFFATDLGFDYLWLSNGMGFGIETWKISGAIFDRHAFFPEKAGEATEQLLNFWRDLRREIPHIPIETRGSNFSVGVEMASDACPLREIYEKYKIAPPVNSPWAALNYNIGIEIAAWMSHIADSPYPHIPYRFYIHDPWFLNSPWLERYGREPWDIYLPLSVARLNSSGKVESADTLSLLSVDDSRGEMPAAVPLEVTPHLAAAFNTRPDFPAPFLWVYPLYEYDSLKSKHPDVIFNEDYFSAGAVQEGMPLNTVIGTRALQQTDPALLASMITIVPVHGVTAENFGMFKRILSAGGTVLFYGSTANSLPELQALLGIQCAVPLSGRVSIKTDLEMDSCRTGTWGTELNILPLYHGGGLTETVVSDTTIHILATACQGEEERVVALIKKLPLGGKAAFLRSLLPTAARQNIHSQLVDLDSPGKSFPALQMMRWMMSCFGWKFRNIFQTTSQPGIRLTISRNCNAFYFSIFAPDTMVEYLVNTPYGAPVFDERECLIDQTGARIYPAKSMHCECRLFVTANASSVISCKIGRAGHAGYTARRYYSGIVNADLRFFPPPGVKTRLEITDNTENPEDLQGGELLTPEWCNSPHGRYAIIRNFTGRIHFSW